MAAASTSFFIFLFGSIVSDLFILFPSLFECKPTPPLLLHPVGYFQLHTVWYVLDQTGSTQWTCATMPISGGDLNADPLEPVNCFRKSEGRGETS